MRLKRKILVQALLIASSCFSGLYAQINQFNTVNESHELGKLKVKGQYRFVGLYRNTEKYFYENKFEKGLHICMPYLSDHDSSLAALTIRL